MKTTNKNFLSQITTFVYYLNKIFLFFKKVYVIIKKITKKIKISTRLKNDQNHAIY